jgi:outer membrane protein assembly factor BamB
VQEYASFDAVLAQNPMTKTIGQSGVRLGADEAHIYSSGQTFDTLYSFDSTTNTSTQIPVAGADIHVDGLSAQGGHALVLDGFSFDQYLYTFDAGTGAQLGKVVAATQVTRLHGLSNACEKATLQ